MPIKSPSREGRNGNMSSGAPTSCATSGVDYCSAGCAGGGLEGGNQVGVIAHDSGPPKLVDPLLGGLVPDVVLGVAALGSSAALLAGEGREGGGKRAVARHDRALAVEVAVGADRAADGVLAHCFSLFALGPGQSVTL